jgi:eukaryotic-like serine/threonine-protein kinase
MRKISVGNRLTAQVATARTGCVVTLAGTIDETFDGAKLRAEARGHVLFDLDEVKRITSFGVREWIRLVSAVEVPYLGYLRARPALVTQFNIVFKFAGRGHLISLYAPYVCDCGNEFEILFDLRRDHATLADFSPPTWSCPQCSEQAILDEVPSTYFGYIASVPAPRMPPGAEALLDGKDAPPAFKMDKEVAGNLTALWLSGEIDDRTRFRRILDGLEGDVVAVLDGLMGATTAGLATFLERAGGTGVQLYLARASLETLEALAGVPANPPARVISTRLPFVCTACGHVGRYDLDEARRAALLGPTHPGPACESCGSLTAPEDPRERVVAALARPFALAPRSVRVYLEERPEGMESGVLAATDPSWRPAEEGAAPKADVISGKYRLMRSLGIGGMAEIFLARQVGPEGFDRMVALKRIHPHLAKNDVFVDMFVQEARLSARLSHPNIVPIYDVGQMDGHFYIVMEYVRGWDLATILRFARSLGVAVPTGVGIRIAADICAGLSAAHGYVNETGKHVPVVHRDVSPSNVLVSQRGIVKLTDFGIAKAADTVIPTETGVVKGKIAYMAPERLEGEGETNMDPRQDVFSVGAILHEALRGEFLFHRDSRVATLRAVVYDPVPTIANIRSDVPPEVDEILARALAKKPKARYASAIALHADLDNLLLGHRELPAKTSDVEEWLEALVTRGVEVGVIQRPTDSMPPHLEQSSASTDTRRHPLPGAKT